MISLNRSRLKKVQIGTARFLQQEKQGFGALLLPVQIYELKGKRSFDMSWKTENHPANGSDY